MLVYETEHVQLHATANSKILDLEYHKCFIVNSELIALLLITLGICDSSLTDPRDTLIKMAFIKEESEDMKIEETFRVNHEDTETQTKMEFIKEKSEDMKIEETFRGKHEDTEEQTKMVFIKEESEDMKIEETFRGKHEDTETQTGWFSF